MRISTGDGSWAEITTERVVTEGGPRALWRMVEDAHRFWEKAGQPGWERFGLTVRADGTQHVWLDEPTGPCVFVVPSGR